MLPSNRLWDTLCPRAHCRRRRNRNLLIRSMLLSTTPRPPRIITTVSFRPRQDPTLSQDPAFQRIRTRFAYFEKSPKYARVRLRLARFARRWSTSSYESTWRPHISAEKRPSDWRDVEPSTWEMTSGQRQKSKEDLRFLRNADEFNRADLEALFHVGW